MKKGKIAIIGVTATLLAIMLVLIAVSSAFKKNDTEILTIEDLNANVQVTVGKTDFELNSNYIQTPNNSFNYKDENQNVVDGKAIVKKAAELLGAHYRNQGGGKGKYQNR